VDAVGVDVPPADDVADDLVDQRGEGGTVQHPGRGALRDDDVGAAEDPLCLAGGEAERAAVGAQRGLVVVVAVRQGGAFAAAVQPDDQRAPAVPVPGGVQAVLHARAGDVVAEGVDLGVGQPALHETRDGDRSAAAHGDRRVLRDGVDQVEPEVAAPVADVAECAAAGLALAVAERQHDVPAPVEPCAGDGPVEVVRHGAGDRIGGGGVHAERAGRQARRVDRPEPGRAQGEGGDLFAAVERHRVEDEGHAVVAAVGVGGVGGAGQRQA
jgi:hypothetical protein